MSQDAAINIINDTPYKLWVSLDLATSSLTPDLLYTDQVVVINQTQSVSINITISVLRLFTGASFGWISKRLSFKYGRVDVPDESIDYSVSFPVYPSSTGCARLKTKQQCSTFPGCIFCVQFPSMRVLQLLGNASRPAVRRLYSNTVPASYSNTEVEEKLRLGYCSDGWRDEDCMSSGTKTRHLSLHLITNYHSVSFAVLLTALTIAFVNFSA